MTDKTHPWSKTEDPVVTEAGHGDVKITHPAFATISASYISGSAVLFDSNVEQYGMVRISISEAELNQSGYHKSVFGSLRGFVEVEMSEAQWVSFVSRTNRGSGTPCTLRHYRNGDKIVHVPRLPAVEKMADRIDAQIEDMRAQAEKTAQASADELRNLIEARIPKGRQTGLLNLLDRLVGQGKSVREFQHKCLRETQEKLVTEAKIEVESLVTNVVQRLGVASVQQLGAVLQADPDKVMQLIGPPQETRPPVTEPARLPAPRWLFRTGTLVGYIDSDKSRHVGHVIDINNEVGEVVIGTGKGMQITVVGTHRSRIFPTTGDYAIGDRVAFKASVRHPTRRGVVVKLIPYGVVVQLSDTESIEVTHADLYFHLEKGL